MRRFTTEEDSFIISNYHSLGLIGCGKALGRPSGSINCRRSILGLPLLGRETRCRLVKETHPHKTLESPHKVHPAQFMSITTPEVAYLLGLLWADGYVHDQKVVLTCVRDDAVEYMPTFFKTGEWGFDDYQHERYGVIMRPSRTIRTGNVLLARYLISQGYGSKSTTSANQILSTIPKELHPYWFRGFLDGDGYISYSKNGIFWIRITSSFEQDWSHMETLCNELAIVFQIRRDRYVNRHGKTNSRSVFNINSAAGVKRFCDYVYANRATDQIGLTRKYEKWREIEAFMRTRPRVGHLFGPAPHSAPSS